MQFAMKISTLYRLHFFIHLYDSELAQQYTCNLKKSIWPFFLCTKAFKNGKINSFSSRWWCEKLDLKLTKCETSSKFFLLAPSSKLDFADYCSRAIIMFFFGIYWSSSFKRLFLLWKKSTGLKNLWPLKTYHYHNQQLKMM